MMVETVVESCLSSRQSWSKSYKMNMNAWTTNPSSLSLWLRRSLFMWIAMKKTLLRTLKSMDSSAYTQERIWRETFLPKKIRRMKNRLPRIKYRQLVIRATIIYLTSMSEDLLDKRCVNAVNDIHDVPNLLTIIFSWKASETNVRRSWRNFNVAWKSLLKPSGVKI